jgi:pimeloyl-ACP methyl ester carboxylesterase
MCSPFKWHIYYAFWVMTTYILPAAPPSNFKHQMAFVNGVNIHYVIGGEGDPLLLIHGFGQNWFMWNRLLPELSKHFTVVAPDLRGVGESEKPDGGYSKKNMAADIHELVKKIGFSNVAVVGHDVGLMVAYAYAAQYGDQVRRLALLDALIPGLEPVWHQISTTAWHFGFFRRPVAANLVTGREQEFFLDFWAEQSHIKNAFTEQETEEFIRAFSTRGAIAGSFQWYAQFAQDAKDNQEFISKKLKMPVLAMGGEYSSHSYLADHVRLVADNVTEAKITDAGHWLVQEQTEQVQAALLDFLLGK